MTTITRIGFCAVLALGLAACSGGSSGDANTTSQPLPVPPATVGILITDAYGTRWDQAFATITSIELLGEDDYRAVIFEGEETVDLLSLADYSELFAVADNVFPGEVDKIRLRLSSLELVELDDMGNEVDRVLTKLVGNGKIDIKPATPLLIAGGETIFIELDFDMEKAFKATETGNGEVIVRPVIFAHVRIDGMPSRLTRIFGFVHSIDETEPNFVLCQTGLYANHDDFDEEDDDDDDHDRCILVRTDDLTGIFDADGNAVSFASIMREDELTAVGFLRYEDDDDDEDGEDDSNDDADDDDFEVEDDFVLEAVVIELGTNFDRYYGTVLTDVDGDAFDLQLASSQGFETDTVIATQMTFPGTRIFSTEGDELDATAIVPETPAIVDGVIALGDADTVDVLRAALIVLDLEPGEQAEILRGEIISVEPDEGTLQLMVGETPRCVNASSSDIFLISTADGFISESGELEDLEPGDRTDVYGEEGVDGCFVATDILSDID